MITVEQNETMPSETTLEGMANSGVFLKPFEVMRELQIDFRTLFQRALAAEARGINVVYREGIKSETIYQLKKPEKEIEEREKEREDLPGPNLLKGLEDLEDYLKNKKAERQSKLPEAYEGSVVDGEGIKRRTRPDLRIETPENILSPGEKVGNAGGPVLDSPEESAEESYDREELSDSKGLFDDEESLRGELEEIVSMRQEAPTDLNKEKGAARKENLVEKAKAHGLLVKVQTTDAPKYLDRNNPEALASERRKEAAKHSYQSRMGRRVLTVLGIGTIEARISMSPELFGIEDPDEFLRVCAYSPKDVFPPDHVRTGPEGTSRRIYDILKDKLGYLQFERLFLDFLDLDCIGGSRSNVDVQQYFLLNKTTAVLERAGVREITFGQLSEIYENVPRARKISIFAHYFMRNRLLFTDNQIERGTVWDEESCLKLLTGYMSYRPGKKPEWIAQDYAPNVQMQVHDALCKLPGPWVGVIYSAVNAFGKYADYLFSKTQKALREKAPEK